MDIFKDAEVVKVADPCGSWCDVLLSNGKTFRGQLNESLLKLARMGLVDVNLEALEKLEAAKTVIKKAEQAYKDLVLDLGGELCESGSDEDYDSWYKIPGVPGSW